MHSFNQLLYYNNTIIVITFILIIAGCQQLQPNLSKPDFKLFFTMFAIVTIATEVWRCLSGPRNFIWIMLVHLKKILPTSYCALRFSKCNWPFWILKVYDVT